MKRLFLAVIMAFPITLVSAVAITDIDTIFSISQTLVNDTESLSKFVYQLRSLRDDSFLIVIANSTQTVVLSNAQKMGLLAQYQNYKTQIQADLNALP